MLTRESKAEEILACLRQALPGETFRSVEVYRDGWDNLAACVDERWVFRFPVKHDFKRDAERNFLAALGGRSPVTIPRICFWSNQPPFMGYTKLPGVFAPTEWFQDPDPAWTQTLAKGLAAFLHAVHSAISVAQARDWGVWQVPPRQDRAAQRLAAAAGLDASLRAAALHLSQVTLEPAVERALYGDLHFGNLLFDPVTRELCGIIDFGGVCVGDPAYELYDLSCRWPGLAWAVADAYEALGGPQLSRSNARRYAAEFCLDVLADPGMIDMRGMALTRLKTLAAAERV